MPKPELIFPKKTWQHQLAHCIQSLPELYEYIQLEPPADFLNQALDFPIKTTHAFANRIQKNNPNDPLLLQILASPSEFLITENFYKDPLEEKKFNPLPGVLHKYKNRILIMLHGQCAIHCRYCFRRNFPYSENQPSATQFEKILEYLNQNPDISEVIFSGGDPLIISDHRLSDIFKQLRKINSLQRIRFHTRIPVVLPDRITPEFTQILSQAPAPLVITLHVNHAQEIDASVRAALSSLKPHAILLNQAVLLKNINNNLQTQINLHQTLFQCGVLPYYLHLLDKVQGTAHFDIPEQEALELIQQLQANLPGYLVPKLAREIPGKPSKTTYI